MSSPPEEYLRLIREVGRGMRLGGEAGAEMVEAAEAYYEEEGEAIAIEEIRLQKESEAHISDLRAREAAARAAARRRAAEARAAAAEAAAADEEEDADTETEDTDPDEWSPWGDPGEGEMGGNGNGENGANGNGGEEDEARANGKGMLLALGLLGLGGATAKTKGVEEAALMLVGAGAAFWFLGQLKKPSQVV